MPPARELRGLTPLEGVGAALGLPKWMKLLRRKLEMGAVALLLHLSHPRLPGRVLKKRTLHGPGPTPDRSALNYWGLWGSWGWHLCLFSRWSSADSVKQPEHYPSAICPQVSGRRRLLPQRRIRRCDHLQLADFHFLSFLGCSESSFDPHFTEGRPEAKAIRRLA